MNKILISFLLLFSTFCQAAVIVTPSSPPKVVSFTPPVISDSCFIEVKTSLSNRFINSNMIRFVEVSKEYPKILKFDYIGNHMQTNLMEINYPSGQEALSSLEQIKKKIISCNRS